MPTFLQKMPVLGGLLRKVSLGTIKDLMDDLNYVANRVSRQVRRLTALSLVKPSRSVAGAVCFRFKVLQQQEMQPLNDDC